MDSEQERIGQIWSAKQQQQKCAERLHWYQSPTILHHITQLICAEAQPDIGTAIRKLIRTISPALPYKHGISVACGTGIKEMRLVEDGLVEHFDLYELSEYAVEQGVKIAADKGLENRITFHHGDALKAGILPGSHDFVYWDNALHHMMDAYAAVEWSKSMLAAKGCFFMYDFVGPTRFQWTDEQTGIVTHVLESMDDAYFFIPNSEYMWKKAPNKMNLEEMLQADPSEAADSDNILPAFRSYFPEGKIIPLGGLIYVLALDGIMVNIPENSVLLKKLLNIDLLLSKQRHNYFAVAYAVI